MSQEEAQGVRFRTRSRTLLEMCGRHGLVCYDDLSDYLSGGAKPTAGQSE